MELQIKIEPLLKTERLYASSPADIARAAHILRSGGTVAFPTETVYGLGANALDPAAVARIFAAKQRPSWDPLIVHLADRSQLPQIADWSSFRHESLSSWHHPESSFREAGGPASRLPFTTQALMDAFWPGPLTLLLPRTPAVPDAVTAGRPLVGVRIPNHNLALELLRQTGLPIAAPSANTFSHTSPTSAAHVLADLDGRIDAVLDGGPTTVGLESTVFDPLAGIIYRPGAITLEMLESLVGAGAVHHHQPQTSPAEPGSLPSPGVGLRHYAPRARLILVDGNATRSPHPSSLIETIDRAFDGSAIPGVMLPDGWNSGRAHLIFPWGPWHQTEILAQRLFAGLRDLDDRGASFIVCPVPAGSSGLSAAIRDRLQKAAKP